MSTLAIRVNDLATRISTECKALRTMVNGNVGDLSGLTTAAKTSLVAALNELQSEINAVASAAGASINDAGAATSTTETYSISKIIATINSAISDLTSGAPTALNTLDELSAALGDDANFAATITTALGKRVRVDAAQGLTTGEQQQARDNIGAIAAAAIGNPDTDFVSTFNAGLV